MEPDLPLSEQTDRAHVLVVGGGPGGSTTAALLARKGLRVTLVEKGRHPRFHIGESLLPMNMPILERLGVFDQVMAIGRQKHGADFPSPNQRGYNTFQFARTLNPGTGYAVQIRREELDQLLFRHAAACGAETHEETEVLRIDFGAAAATARLRQADGTERDLRVDYVVDATGRNTLLGTALRLKRKHQRHQSAALFAHFAGVQRRAGEDAGNISIYRFPAGWVWMIPLPGDCMSIGAVCYPEYLKERRGSNADFLLTTLSRIPGARDRIKAARIIGNLHVTGNYSYTCTRMSGHRWIMVGDAFAFLDPIFSSGVYLAKNSAERAAEVVAGALREPGREAGPATRLRALRASWPGPAVLVHLPLHLTGDVAAVCASARHPAGGAGHGVDARGRCLQQFPGVVAAAAVQADLPVDLDQPVAAVTAQSPQPPSPGRHRLRGRGSRLRSPQAANSTLAGGLSGMEYRRRGADAPPPATALCAITFGAQQASANGSAALPIHLNLPVLVGTGLDGAVACRRPPRSRLRGTRAVRQRRPLPRRPGRDRRRGRRRPRGGGGRSVRRHQPLHDARPAPAPAAHVQLLLRHQCRNRGHGALQAVLLRTGATGFRGWKHSSWPAATAVGRQDHSGVLQVYWLAGTEPGRPLENPRQVSAFNYPRQYGPAPPRFSRAMLVTGGLLISGTGSILGHASHHAHDLSAQLDEILRNLASLRQAGRRRWRNCNPGAAPCSRSTSGMRPRPNS